MAGRLVGRARTVAFAAILLLPSAAVGGPQVGMITAIEGEVKLLTHPSKKLEGPPPHALFEGLNYSVRNARPGDLLEKGNVLRTPPGSKARILYPNGDQIHVAPGTAFRIDWDKDAADGQPVLRLRHGKSRFVIQKGGPRSKFRIHTKTAVMGVRGTDFVVAVQPQTGATEVASLRGEIDVRPVAPKAEPVQIARGQTASVPAAPPEAAAGEAPPPAVEVRPTSQLELEVIQKASTIKAAPPAEAPPPEVAREIATLEKAAVDATLRDIEARDPELHAKLEGEPPPESLDALNTSTVEALLPDAPEAPEVAGPMSDSSLDEAPSAAAPAAGPDEANGFRFARFRFEGLHVEQGGELEADSPILSWAPRYRFGRFLSLSLRLGFTLLKQTGDRGVFPMVEAMLVPGLRLWGPLELEPHAGIQTWTVNGGTNPGFGLGLAWNFSGRSLGVLERWVAGVTVVPGSHGETAEFRAGVGFGW